MDSAHLFSEIKTIAVLGIKTEAQAGQPSFTVPSYLQAAGFKIVPVPVYYPEVKSILGEPVYRQLSQIPFGVDVVCVFRRPTDLMLHLTDIIQKKPRWVWLQSGIRNDAFATELEAAGIGVVQDRCMMVEHRAWAAAQ